MRMLGNLLPAGLILASVLFSSGAPALAQDAQKEIEQEIQKITKGLTDKVQALLKKQDELEKKLAEKDKEIAELKKKVEELAAAKAPEAKKEADKPKGHPLLGVEPAAVDEETRTKLNLKEGQGTRIATVQPGSPADKAGIKPGDIVISLGGKEPSGPGLRDLVQNFAPGEKVEIVYLRGAEKITRSAELVDRDQFMAQLAAKGEAPAAAAGQSKAGDPVRLGVLVGETDAGLEVQNVEPGKTGAAAQLKEGDLILALNGKAVKSLDDLSAGLAAAKVGEELAIDYKRKDGEFRAKVIAAGERGEPKFVSAAPLKEKPAEPAKKPEAPAAAKAPGSLGVQVLEDSGVKVVEVKAGGAAAAAGIKEGDVLMEVDGKPIRTIDDLKGVLKGKSAGDTLSVTVSRGGERKKIDGVKLAGGEGKAPEKAPEKAAEPQKPRGVMGITAVESEDRGLVVSVVNDKGPADKAGIKKDDIILKVNGTEVKGFAELEKALTEAKAGDKLKLTVKRGDETKEIEIVLGSPETSALFPPVRAAVAAASQVEGGQPVYLGVALLEESVAAPAPAAPSTEGARVAINEVYEGGPAASAGLAAGDQVLSVDGRAVRTLEDIGQAVGRHSPGETVKVRVSRAGATLEAGVLLGGGR
jgi:S1-C subfamily serine protease